MSYPNTPGFQKGSATSEFAAETMIDEAASLREQVEQLYRGGFTGTAREAVARLGWVWPKGQPRITELYKQGVLVLAGATRIDPVSKRPAEVLKIA